VEKLESLSPDESTCLLAAFRGLSEILGCTVDEWGFDYESNCFIAKGVSFKEGIDPAQVIRDISMYPRRVDFIDGGRAIMGLSQIPYTSTNEMTQFMVQSFKGSVVEGTSKAPTYLRQAVQDYKNAHGFGTKRGPKPKRTIRLDDLDSVDALSLDKDEVIRLKEIIRKAEELNV